MTPRKIYRILEAAERPVTCMECGWRGAGPMEYHPFAFCALVWEGLDPEQVIYAAVRHYDANGWPESLDTGDSGASPPASAPDYPLVKGPSTYTTACNCDSQIEGYHRWNCGVYGPESS